MSHINKTITGKLRCLQCDRKYECESALTVNENAFSGQKFISLE